MLHLNTRMFLGTSIPFSFLFCKKNQSKNYHVIESEQEMKTLPLSMHRPLFNNTLGEQGVSLQTNFASPGPMSLCQQEPLCDREQGTAVTLSMGDQTNGLPGTTSS